MEKYIVKVNGKEYEVEIEKVGAGAQEVKSEPEKAATVKEPAVKSDAKGTALEAGAAGKVWKILKKPGDKVEKGETAVILEAMKMEIPMVAPEDGTVVSIDCHVGDPVEAGTLLATID